MHTQTKAEKSRTFTVKRSKRPQRMTFALTQHEVYDINGIANYAIVNGVLVARDKTAELSRIKNTIDYPQLVENKIRKKYSVSAELAILRQRNSKPEEFAEYNAFCELCKSEAKNELNIGVQNYASTIY